MGEDYEALSLTELIRLQTHLSDVLHRRFEKPMALAFTDIVGSTSYFARFGNEAGRRLQQLHLDLLTETVGAAGGRIVDTAGDGGFCVFATVESAASAMIALQARISAQNATRAAEHQLRVRIGVHHGRVLTDGTVVSGDAVNLCARVASIGDGGDIRVTHAAFAELDNQHRIRCRPMPPVEVKGIFGEVRTMSLDWFERRLFPSSVRIAETGDIFPLPWQDIITFGRLKGGDGEQTNDVVLSLSAERATVQISRWHFELRRLPDGFVLRPLSSSATEVDGRPVVKGEEARVTCGTVVRVAKVMTLEFLADASSVSSVTTGFIGP